MSSRKGFWPESVRKKAGRCVASSVFLNLVRTRSTASVTLVAINGTQWNASLPGSGAGGISFQYRVFVKPDVNPRIAVPGQLTEGFEFEHPQQSGMF